MLEEINELLKSTNEAEIAFEELRDKNEDEIVAMIKSHEAYKKLDRKCTGDYRCFISILSDANVYITYKSRDTFNKQGISVNKSGVDSGRNDFYWKDTQAFHRLNELATEFYEEFYNEKK